MKKITAAGIAAASILLACIAFAGCTGGACSSMFTENDNGAVKDVNQGCTIYIELPENPSTGYSWEMNTGGLTLVNDTYIPDSVSENMVGTGGIHKWELSTGEKGDYSIEGIYKRPWENTTAGDETWNMTVNVV
ncbi:inhibitor of cysteine peptidase [Methanomicrobium sp. W14]|uniref:protease inhibitor I42 family protein n=1 Tax=Methanomicrobium sp. W14 TaxID=2817839 RepID=UPI001AE41A1F|nr:protease inhibitor I42 family protein [Methanomicrobium sp. W14]MBP2133414.1 inhibitor of cysteine peptidase [Methanomicrobium sp. W14]